MRPTSSGLMAEMRGPVVSVGSTKTYVTSLMAVPSSGAPSCSAACAGWGRGVRLWAGCGLIHSSSCPHLAVEKDLLADGVGDLGDKLATEAEVGAVGLGKLLRDVERVVVVPLKRVLEQRRANGDLAREGEVSSI